MNSRIKKLAKILINYSCKLKKGEKILIECFGSTPFPLVRELIKETYKAEGTPYFSFKDYTILRETLKNCRINQLKFMANLDVLQMREVEAHIIIRAHDNVSELADLYPDKMNLYTKYYIDIVTKERFKKNKWVIIRYPNNSMAQLANKSLEEFENYFFKVCNLDYSKMSKAMNNLVDLMNVTNLIKINGPGTDIIFSKKNIPVVKCAGEINIPDGEIFTAPIKNSVNGKITFNCPAIFQGKTYENISLEFRNGKVINAISNDSINLNKVLEIDKGAKYIGEFALGVNPYIKTPIKDLLFDEKIAGSFHIALGQCYPQTDNGNNSAIHWDITCIQTPEYGGGKIYFDDVLIRKNGRFVIKDLENLNPENIG